jgi:hypothetical protein
MAIGHMPEVVLLIPLLIIGGFGFLLARALWRVGSK